MEVKRLMTIKLSRDLFREVDRAAILMTIPNRTAIIEGLLRYAIGQDDSLTTFQKAKKGLMM